MDHDEVLATFDAQIRRDLTPPVPTWQVEDLGRLIRQVAPAGGRTGAFIGWQDFGDLRSVEIDTAIAEQVAYFRELGRHSEWKHYDHDRPVDLSDRLVAAGLTREDPEALVIGQTDAVLAATRAAGLPDGVGVRRLTDVDELAAVATLHEVVWGEDWSWLADELRVEITTKPDETIVYLAEDESTGALMCSGWIRFQPGTDFAGLWGGSTHPDWRRRGAYRALVEVRAALAAERGVRYLQVDASPNSEPILRRLGLERMATTTPHVWAPPDAAG